MLSDEIGLLRPHLFFSVTGMAKRIDIYQREERPKDRSKRKP
jgi:hypothetical protein